MTAQTISARTSRGRKIGFYAVVVTTTLLVLGALFEALPFTVVSWFSSETLQEMYPEVTSMDSHRIHLFGVAILGWLLVLPPIVQFARPKTKFAAAAFGLVAVLILIPSDLASGTFDPLEIVALLLFGAMVWLHPGRQEATFAPMHQRPLVLAVAGLVGWTVFAVIEYSLQLTGVATDPHVEFGHFGIMGQVAVLIGVAAIIGVSRLSGRRIVAGLSSVSAIYVGLASVVYPDHASSLGVPLGLIAVVWALLYLWSVFSKAKQQEPA